MSQLIYKKMSEVMKEIKSVSKDQKNTAQGYKFRGIDQFVNALYPALTKHGVFMAPRCVKEQHEIRDVTRSNGKAGYDKHVNILVEFDFFAEDGSKVTVGPIPGEGLDSGDKATNKAMSAALKYALIQTFSIPTEDMAEADLESPEIVGTNPKQDSKLASTTIHTLTDITTNNLATLATFGTPVTNKTEPLKRTSFRKNTTPVVKEETKLEGWE